MAFQPGFLWGAGSSAYQTEGAWNEDGKGAGIWDEFCHTAGKIKNQETGDDASFTYRLFETDLALIKKLGLNSYRFSISWPRVLPEGSGKVNLKGLCFYNRMVDSLLAAGVTPVITLYHWDLPLALEREGGWENRKTAEAFMEYAGLIAHHFDGRVTRYITLNEPQCFLGLGYGSGLHAPGKRLSNQALVQCVHHALLAHGGAAAAMRAASASPLSIGLASTGNICYPAPEGSGEPHGPDAQRADCSTIPAEHGAALSGHSGHGAEFAEKAAYDAMFTLREDDWVFSHKWLLDAAVFGHYPDEFPAFRQLNEVVTDADLRLIQEPMDFIGLNAYHGIPVDADGNRTKIPSGFPRTAMDWPITPECLYYGPRFLYERYGLPLIVTENGRSCRDRVFLDGAVHDADRIDFLTRYLQQLNRAAKAGVPVNGYFHWSLTDNFEWHEGYDERFGLIYVDYETQKRVVKDSGYWYRYVIENNGII